MTFDLVGNFISVMLTLGVAFAILGLVSSIKEANERGGEGEEREGRGRGERETIKRWRGERDD